MARQRDRGDGNAPLYATLWFGSIIGIGGLVAVTATIGPASIPIWGMAVAAAAIIFRGPVGKAIGRRIAGEESGAIPPELPAEILDELDAVRNRLFELEERMDFSERLLAQKQAEPRGGGGA